jgi:fructose-1-phosphate kinase PfkB-like protein
VDAVVTVLCVNPNPAVDRVAVVGFDRGRTLRPVRSFEWPGGSGVHAAHVARQLGSSAEVIAAVGGAYGRRSTFSLLDIDEGNVCDVAEHGGPADDGLGEALVHEFSSRAGNMSVCVLSGSLPAGLPADIYAQMAEIAHTNGVPTVVDATGDALLAVVGAPVLLLKASLEELVRDGVMGQEATAEVVLDRANAWVASGALNVCVSLGSAGLLWVSSHGASMLAAAPARAYNTIGCGDALVGAVAAAVDDGESVASSLVRGIAAATANLAYDAPGHCTAEDVAQLSESVSCEIVDERTLGRAIALSRPK